MSSAFVHLLASHKPSAHSPASFGAGDAGMHTKDARSKSQQKSRHDQINMVFDSLRQKYGMHTDRAEVLLAWRQTPALRQHTEPFIVMPRN